VFPAVTAVSYRPQGSDGAFFVGDVKGSVGSAVSEEQCGEVKLRKLQCSVIKCTVVR
jgi:hypothetical protein